MPTVDFGAPFPLNKVFIPGVTTRPALLMVDFFKVFACADVNVEVVRTAINTVESAKIFEAFKGNIGNTFLSLFSLCLGCCIKEDELIDSYIQGVR